MFKQRLINLAIFSWLLVLAGCSSTGATYNKAQKDKQNSREANLTFISKEYGFKFTYPASLNLSRTYGKSYLDSANWKTYAGKQYDLGIPVAALSLAKSNDIRAGELRIGISTNPRAIKNWAILPQAAKQNSLKHIK